MAIEIVKDGPKIFNSFISLCGNSLGNECALIVLHFFFLWRLTETILSKNFQIHFYMKNSVTDIY